MTEISRSRAMVDELEALDSVNEAAEAICGLLGDTDGEDFEPSEESGSGDDEDGEDAPAEVDEEGEVDDEEEEDEEDLDLDEESDEDEDDDSSEAEDDEGSDEDAEPTLYKVTVDGEEFEVTLQEALAGYQR